MGSFISVFKAGLILLGWLIGIALNQYLINLIYPISILILAFIGFRMITDSKKYSPEHRTYTNKDLRSLSGFSLALGINSFLAGVGIGLIKLDIWLLTAILVFVSFLIIQIGIRLGKYGRYRFGMQAEVLGGILILVLAVRMLIRYLF